MAEAKAFFDQELGQLHHEINRLEGAISEYAPDDPRASGLRAELRLERRNEQIVGELARLASDPVQTLLQCHIRREKVQQTHARSHDASAESTLRSDQWWDTLYDEQYLSDLTRRLETWLHKNRPNSADSGR